MKYNDEVFMNQFPLVKRFVYHITYFRVLRAAYGKNGLECEFWTHSIDAHLLQATICWCMVFGAHRQNEIHWKRLTDNNSKELEDSFRTGLSAHAGIEWSQWQRYWKELTNFRNQFAAHRDLQYSGPVPSFDTALKVTYFYDDWVREVIAPDSFEEPALLELATRLEGSVTPLVGELMKLTENFR